MKRGLAIGVMVGALLGGGWWAWGAIQSQVGINLYDSSSTSWVGARDYSDLITATFTPTGTPFRLPGVGLMARQDTSLNLVSLSGTNITPSHGFAIPGNSSITSLRVVNIPYIGNGSNGNYYPWTGRPAPTDALPSGVGEPWALVTASTMETNGSTMDTVRHSFTQTVAGIATNGAGTALNMNTTPMSSTTMIVDRTAGATDVVEIDIECTIDGTDFVQIATITTLAAEPALASATGIPCRQIRYNVVDVGAGNTLQNHLLATR